MITKIWVNDISVLLDKNHILEFIPTDRMTFNQKINTIVRFSFYLSVLLCLVKQTFKYLYIFILTLIGTFIIYSTTNNNNITETFDSFAELSELTEKKIEAPIEIYPEISQTILDTEIKEIIDEMLDTPEGIDDDYNDENDDTLNYKNIATDSNIISNNVFNNEPYSNTSDRFYNIPKYQEMDTKLFFSYNYDKNHAQDLASPRRLQTN